MFRTVFSALSLASLAALLALTPLAAAAQTPKPARSAKPASTGQTVNVNTASAAEFEALPGIGPKLAARIVEYREKHGSFKKVEDLMNVRGLGEKNFLKLKAQLTIGAPKSADRQQ